MRIFVSHAMFKSYNRDGEVFSLFVYLIIYEGKRTEIHQISLQTNVFSQQRLESMTSQGALEEFAKGIKQNCCRMPLTDVFTE